MSLEHLVLHIRYIYQNPDTTRKWITSPYALKIDRGRKQSTHNCQFCVHFCCQLRWSGQRKMKCSGKTHFSHIELGSGFTPEDKPTQLDLLCHKWCENDRDSSCYIEPWCQSTVIYLVKSVKSMSCQQERKYFSPFSVCISPMVSDIFSI